jgi:MerR family mercuric resistance operon transcriptional regulator
VLYSYTPKKLAVHRLILLNSHSWGITSLTTISKVANELGINLESIRFYERRGLIKQPIKPDQGYRHYPEETINRIRFIKRSQELGFTLDEIANLMQLNDSPCHQVQEMAELKLTAVQAKLADLQRLQTALSKLVEQCNNNQDSSHCPIIDSLLP